MKKMKKMVEIMKNNFKIGVIGAGSWGTALANLLAKKGYELDLWVFEPEVKKQIEEERENKSFFKGFPLSENIHPTNDLKKAVYKKDLVLIVVPSHIVRRMAENMADYIGKDTILVSASKGIENETFMLMSQVLLECIPSLSQDKIAVMSGPSFAKEVALEMATIVTVAATDSETAKTVQKLFFTDYFRPYTSADVIGTQLGGALKNVIALAGGIADGLKLGYNSKSALITKGLAEMIRLGTRMGGYFKTFCGASGIGDLVLTSTGSLSRNYTAGKKIGEGQKLDEILADMKMVVEGVKTTKSVYDLSQKLGVEMPIFHQIYYVLFENHDPRESIRKLMTRDLNTEFE